jgi:hypothetical protein
MSTKNLRIEEVLDSAPKPGDVGAPMASYAEIHKAQNPEPAPARAVSEVDEALAEVTRLSGKSIGDLTQDEFDRIPIKLSARTTQGMTELSVIFKDPSMTGHWFNRKAKEGLRVQQAYMQGFTACTKADVEMCHATTSDENGSLVQGDLVLLKIPKIVLWSRQKDYQETAKARVNRAMNDPRAAARPGDGPGQLPRGADYFIPDTAQASRVDANEARKLVYS